MMAEESFNEQALLAVTMSAHQNDMDDEASLAIQLASMQTTEEIEKDLVSLGFSEEQVKNALEITDGNKEDAMNYLLVS
jgi:Holliday junction resolvasome RuvABC DNA-binding subunit